MDEKQTAALREVYEAACQFPTLTTFVRKANGEYFNKLREIHWKGFLACYQHLAEQLKDGERYRAIRQCGKDWSNLRVFDYRGAIDAQALDHEADALVAALDQQKEKQQ
ncbi:hypothetical protein [Ralstonia holmesii]|uniref:hypothetical protein n=1 Tax=Ralstonia holmesii TaxID=3058602 RepID=UPI0028F4DCFD|nr:hypothetical protein [Ralstonia sp. LMG 32967]CAJ0705999.1 hypothetical protein R11007_04746 [Ralstonia sp. LMG 32967]